MLKFDLLKLLFVLTSLINEQVLGTSTPSCQGNNLAEKRDSITILNFLTDPNHLVKLVTKYDSGDYVFYLDLTNLFAINYPEELAWNLSYKGNQSEESVIYTNTFITASLRISGDDINKGVVPSCIDKTQCSFKINAFHLYTGKVYLTNTINVTLTNTVSYVIAPLSIAKIDVEPEDVIPCLLEESCVLSKDYQLIMDTCSGKCDQSSRLSYDLNGLIWTKLHVANKQTNLPLNDTGNLNIISFSFEFYSEDNNKFMAQILGNNTDIQNKTITQDGNYYGFPVKTIKDYVETRHAMNLTQRIKFTVVASYAGRILLSPVAKIPVVFSSQEIFISAAASNRQTEVIIISAVIGVVVLTFAILFAVQAIKKIKKPSKQRLPNHGQEATIDEGKV